MLEALSLTSEVTSKRLREGNISRKLAMNPNPDLLQEKLESNGDEFTKVINSNQIANQFVQAGTGGAEERSANGGRR
jgi:hypothetical protein